MLIKSLTLQNPNISLSIEMAARLFRLLLVLSTLSTIIMGSAGASIGPVDPSPPVSDIPAAELKFRGFPTFFKHYANEPDDSTTVSHADETESVLVDG
ncbi:hypothetical protein DFH09DRAFT_1157811 [Mycena vulgaris]|nr:hypothetical protein DFH09DRAFT_1157811 [Mycena vulgaris]